MDTAVGVNDFAHFSNFQGKGGIFERLLHLSGAKEAEIPTFASGAAVRILCCELAEFFMGSVDLRLITSEDVDSFRLRTGDFGLGRRLRSAERMKDQESDRTSLQLDGFLLPECLTRRWLALTIVGLVRYSAPGSFSTCSRVRPSGISQTEACVTEL